MDLVLIKALLEQLENIIADFDERQLDNTDWEYLNRQELMCLFNALSLAKRKAEEGNISDRVQVIGKQYAKEQITKELETTRYIQSPYDQCDEMYDAWCKAFNKSKEVVNRLLS